MATRGPNMGTPMDPVVVNGVAVGMRYALGAQTTGDFFGPSNPLAPVAPQAEGRQFDYRTGYNIDTRPRSGEAVGFEQLRALADNYDLMRLVIETRKDQLEKLQWVITPRDDDAQPDARCKKIQDFLMCPDQEHPWQTWLRMLVEDMLVLDAPSIYVRKTNGGEVFALDLVDGATIKRVIDSTGRTPKAPLTAYQQVLKGLPAVDYSLDEMVYMPRNPRTNRIYGFSPVEQVMMTVNIALRRQLHQLQYYTEGNVPEALIGVPSDWNTDQIRMFQEYWDSLMEGNTAQRRHAKFVPGDLKMQETKAQALKDDYDEWLARIICFAFSIAPSAFVKQMNRATSETAHQQALEEGLVPLQNWVCNVMNVILAKFFNAPDLQFKWNEEEAIDPLEQAQVTQIYVAAKVLHPDEARESLGLPPLTPEQKDDMTPPPPVVMGSDGKPAANDPSAEGKPPAGKPPGKPAAAPQPPETAGKYLAAVWGKKKRY